MAFIAVNFDSIEEARAVPKGNYELQITGATPTETGQNSKHPGTPMIKFTLGFVDPNVNANTFNHYMVFPYDGQENTSFTWLNIKRFLRHFNIEVTTEGGLDTEAVAFEALGKSAMCEVGQTEPNDKGDVYNQLGYLPKLPEENVAGRGSPRGRGRRGE